MGAWAAIIREKGRGGSGYAAIEFRASEEGRTGVALERERTERRSCCRLPWGNEKESADRLLLQPLKIAASVCDGNRGPGSLGAAEHQKESAPARRKTQKQSLHAGHAQPEEKEKKKENNLRGRERAPALFAPQKKAVVARPTGVFKKAAVRRRKKENVAWRQTGKPQKAAIVHVRKKHGASSTNRSQGRITLKKRGGEKGCYTTKEGPLYRSKEGTASSLGGGKRESSWLTEET